MNTSTSLCFSLLVLLFSKTELQGETPLSIEAGVQVSWSTISDHSYQLQWALSAAGPWTDLGSEQSGNGSISNYYDSELKRFYQILETSPDTPPTVSSPVNGGFENGIGGDSDDWSATGAQSPTRTTAQAHTGTHSMHVNITMGATESNLTQRVVNSGGIITAGEAHDFSFWMKQGPKGPSYIQQYEVQWLDASGGVSVSTGLQNFSGTEGVWEEFNLPSLTAPGNAVEARIRFRFVTGAVPEAAGEIFIDDVQLGDPSQPGIPGETISLTPTIVAASQLTFPTTASFSHQPFSSTDLVNWIEMGPALSGNGNPLELIVPQTKPKEFYRVSSPEVVIPPSNGNFIPLFSSATALQPAIQEETPTALITHIADRARDRHARESNFNAYDHYLPWYWEERTIGIEIVDEVAKGGSEIIFNYETLAPLGAAEFRTFFRGIGTVAEYHNNQIAELVGPNQYSATVDQRYPNGGALQIGDRIEIEISMFLAAVMNGRTNYYGTTILYIVGKGIVPWEGRTVDGGPPLDSYELPEATWLGGATTLPYQYSDEPEDHFKQLVGNITPVNVQPFMLGRRLHHTDFENGNHSESGNPNFSIHANKLGPAYVGNSCVDCHTNNGRSLTPGLNTDMFQSVVKVGDDAAGAPHPILGSVLQPQNTGASAEGNAVISSYTITSGTYGDGTSYSLRKPNYSFTGPTPSHFSARVAPQLIGMGLLEAIKESDIVALADPEDENSDGISGRTQTVIDPETGEQRLGRFTYKAAQPKVSHQIAAALNTDMGMTTSLFPILDGEIVPESPEVSDSDLDLMSRYVSLLGVSARRDHDDVQALEGEQIFIAAQCAKCHTQEFTTSSYHPMAELRNQTIRPFTDLLLHDMGPGLADNMGELNASGAEWRTSPLWNIGLTTRVSGGESYLHDGRARNLSEAILWHGGEAEASKENFRTMSAADRSALLKFLESL